VGITANRLLLVSDVQGVLVDGAPLSQITGADAVELLEREVVRDGMAVKVRQALVAVRAGVEVRIGDGSLLSDLGAGTRVLPDGAEEAVS
jgi:acetylglutamate kinase